MPGLFLMGTRPRDMAAWIIKRIIDIIRNLGRPKTILLWIMN